MAEYEVIRKLVSRPSPQVGIQDGNVLLFPRPVTSPHASPWEQAVASVAHLDAEALCTSLAHTGRLVVRSVRSHDLGSATEHLLRLRAKTDQLLAVFGERLSERRKRPELDLLLSQLDAAGRNKEQGRSEALIAAIYTCSEAARRSKTRDGETP